MPHSNFPVSYYTLLWQSYWVRKAIAEIATETDRQTPYSEIVPFNSRK